MYLNVGAVYGPPRTKASHFWHFGDEILTIGWLDRGMSRINEFDTQTLAKRMTARLLWLMLDDGTPEFYEAVAKFPNCKPNSHDFDVQSVMVFHEILGGDGLGKEFNPHDIAASLYNTIDAASKDNLSGMKARDLQLMARQISGIMLSYHFGIDDKDVYDILKHEHALLNQRGNGSGVASSR